MAHTGDQFLHNHPQLERNSNVPEGHVIVDREDWNIAKMKVIHLSHLTGKADVPVEPVITVDTKTTWCNLFHPHAWSKWQEYDQPVIIKGRQEQLYEEKQRRTCSKCGKIQSRDIT